MFKRVIVGIVLFVGGVVSGVALVSWADFLSAETRAEVFKRAGHVPEDAEPEPSTPEGTV